jgi:hypothetical protein
MKIFETLDDNIVLIDGVKYQRMVNETPKPITLELIIVECMVAHQGGVDFSLIENILDRVQVEWFPCDDANDGEEYQLGWNGCLQYLRKKLK